MASRLDRVTRLKTQLRELRVAELERLRAERAGLERQRIEAGLRRDRALDDEAARAAAAPLDEPTFQTGRDFVRGLGNRQKDLARSEAALHERIEATRQEVISARQEERKLLRLEEKERAREAQERQAHDSAELDELVLRGATENAGETRHGAKEVGTE